jgi:hypothetical protein
MLSHYILFFVLHHDFSVLNLKNSKLKKPTQIRRNNRLLCSELRVHLSITKVKTRKAWQNICTTWINYILIWRWFFLALAPFTYLYMSPLNLLLFRSHAFSRARPSWQHGPIRYPDAATHGFNVNLCNGNVFRCNLSSAPFKKRLKQKR